jgi:hypothetical protein
MDLYCFPLRGLSKLLGEEQNKQQQQQQQKRTDALSVECVLSMH